MFKDEGAEGYHLSDCGICINMLSMLANMSHEHRNIEKHKQTQKELGRDIVPRRGHQKTKMFGAKV